MKKLFLIAVLILVSIVSVNAQEQHMKFMGIPIEGTVSDFSSKIVSKGFELKWSGNGCNVYKGSFLNEDVTVFVLGSTDSPLLLGVNIEFPKQLSWSNLSTRFDDYGELFSKKYGQPYKQRRKFTSPYYNGDGYEMSAVRLEKCEYETTWKTAEGLIRISINKKCCVTIDYANLSALSEFSQKQEKENINDI